MAKTELEGVKVEKGVPKLITEDELLDAMIINPTFSKVELYIGVTPDASSKGGIPLRQDVAFVRSDTENTPVLQGKITAFCETSDVVLSVTLAE